jgi:hypothetical protein
MANIDQPGAAGRSISKVLGLRNSNTKTATATLNALTDDDLHDEAVVHALTGTRQLRKDLGEWKHKAENLAAELAATKHDTATELLTSKHEYDAKLTMLRAENAAVRKQLGETGARLEHFERLAFELNTKCEDIEQFYLNELRTLDDAGSHMALSVVSGINNASVALNEAARHSADGLLKQFKNSAQNMKSFLEDLKRRRDVGEYRPRPRPIPREADKRLPEEVEAELSSLVAKLKPVPITDEELHAAEEK